MMTKDDDLSDSQVVTLVLEGHNDMYALIVERYENKLMRYAMFLMKDHDIASDITQEAFISAYVNLRSFKIDKSFSSWIYRILHNGAMNLIKKNKKIYALGVIDETNDDFLIKFDTDKILDKNILNVKVRKCLSQIDIKYKEILALNFFDNLKYEEISDILHIPTSTVGVRIKRGKEILKEVCQNNGVKYER